MSTVSKALAIAALLTVAACVKVTPPRTAPVRPTMQVAAPFAATWDAVIDLFASRNIPIQTLDRSSGLIVAQMSFVPEHGAPAWADCGTRSIPGVSSLEVRTERLAPTHAEMNILVRSTDAGSTVRATVRWTRRGPDVPEPLLCETTNVWESALEDGIRAAAERAAGRR